MHCQIKTINDVISPFKVTDFQVRSNESFVKCPIPKTRAERKLSPLFTIVPTLKTRKKITERRSRLFQREGSVGVSARQRLACLRTHAWNVASGTDLGTSCATRSRIASDDASR